MELSSKLVHLEITVKQDVIISPFTPVMWLLFADVDRLVRLAINYNDSTECLIIFQNDGYIIEVLGWYH